MPSTKPARVTRIREAVPWTLLARGTVVVGKRWMALSSKDRQRLAALVRQSRGRTGNLSLRERAELRKLVRKLELKRAGGELMPLIRGGGKRRRRG